jgi:hypothetical protein
VAACDILDLCFEAEIDPQDSNYVLVRETGVPDVVVRTPRKNFRAFLDDVKAGKFDDM